MIVIGLNQTIDRTINLAALRPGHVLRSGDVALTGGGKAINVARVACVLEHPCQLFGPFPGRLGAYATELLRAENIDVVELDAVDGEIRGTTIVLEANGRSTVINEDGPAMRERAWPTIIERIEQRLAVGLIAQRASSERWLVVAGSVPPATPITAHADLIELAHRYGWSIAVDATNDRLLAAVESGADLVSPNLSEAQNMLFGTAAEAVDPDGPNIAGDALDAAHQLVGRGAKRAMVSVGKHGVAAVGDGIETFVRAPRVDVVNPIGAGDSLLGATVISIEREHTFGQAVQFGVSYAAASVADPTAGYAQRSLIDRLHRQLDLYHQVDEVQA